MRLKPEEVYCTSISSNSSSLLFLLLLVVGLASFQNSSAQVTQPARIEFPIDEDKNLSYDIFPIGEDGLMLTRQIELAQGGMLWEMMKVDTALNLVWRKEYILRASYQLLDYDYYGKDLYMLFSNFSTGDRNLELVIFRPNGSALRSTIKNYIPFNFFDFKVTKKSLLIGGYFNYRPLVINYGFEEKIPRVLPGLFNDRAQLIEMKVNANETFDVVLTGRTFDKRSTLFINTFDSDGNLIKNISLENSELYLP